ncbi:insulin-like growth factor binding protein [Anaeramoeba flamelloides]|uniref:Insulin-like growth factor binding protein n=1 Tax=Anaeramoeba flamelloides TaxID=1746091 RepID=A0ABQ8YXN4_9EUKA|nr:insulin-like growth factor binding protein [Anaeramoeba flamelloides]
MIFPLSETSEEECDRVPAPNGSEFQVNSFNQFTQEHPSIAFFPNSNNYIITWHSTSQDGDSKGVYAQVFDGPDSKLGSEFQVNTYIIGDQAYPSVAVLPNSGNFVITWTDSSRDGDSNGIYAQVFDGPNSKVGTEFQVNTHTTVSQSYPQIAAFNTSDSYIITWVSTEQDGSGNGIFAQLFTWPNTKVNEEFQVNTITDGDQDFPSVATFAVSGNFVVTWHSNLQDGSGNGVYAQIFNGAGTKVGTEFRVNSQTTGDQNFTSVATFNDIPGNFVVTWHSIDQDGSGNGIFAQVFNGPDSKLGPEFQVNTYIAEDQVYSSVATLSSNTFVITWNSQEQDGLGSGVYAQKLNFSSFTIAKMGVEFQVNTNIEGDQLQPQVAASVPNGDIFTITWKDAGYQSGSFENVYAQEYNGTSLEHCYCEAGSYMNSSSPPSCSPMPNGHLSRSSWQNCLQGSYSNETSSTFCYQCSKGSFQNTTGSAFCYLCLPGQFQNETGATESCNYCAIGTFNPQLGQSACPDCIFGFYQNETGGSVCSECPKGTYQNVTRMSYCNDCPIGTYNPVLRGTNFTDCLFCPGGTYGIRQGAPSYEEACENCLPGTWGDKEGATSKENDCYPCPKGFYNEKFGSNTIDSCWPCPKGTYGDSEGLTSLYHCSTCSSTEYSSEINSTSCHKCPIGEQPNENQDRCIQCQEGYYKNETDSNCLPCPDDYFNNNQGLTFCYKCGMSGICLKGGECAFGRDPSSYCSKCLDNYYLKNLSCKKCGSNWWLLFWVFLIVLIIIISIKYRKFLKKAVLIKDNPIFIIYFTFFQLFAGILLMNIKFPTYLSSNAVSSVSIVNFDISILIKQDCFRSFTFYTKYLIIVFLPFALIALMITINIVCRIFSWGILKQKHKNSKDTLNKINAKTIYWIFKILSFFYLPEIIICSQPLQTTYQEGINKYTLDYSPDITTDDEQYKLFYPWFIFFLILFASVMPLSIIIILIIAKKKNFSKYWFDRFGWIWEFYKPNRFWWEIPKITFKFFIILIPIFILSSEKISNNIQVIIMIVIIVTMNICLLVFKPYPFISPENDEFRTVKSLWEKISPEDLTSIGLNTILIAVLSSAINEIDSLLFFLFYPLGAILAFMGTRKNVKQIWYQTKNIKKFSSKKTNIKQKNKDENNHESVSEDLSTTSSLSSSRSASSSSSLNSKKNLDNTNKTDKNSNSDFELNNIISTSNIKND